MSLAAVIIIIMGFAVMNSANDVKVMTKYLEKASSIQPNYETNIVLYTSKTEKVIESLLKIRPENQEEYVTFISEVEAAGQSLSLNLDVKAVDGVKPSHTGKNDGSQISYNISFYGTDKDLLKLLSVFDDMPYYINVSSVSYDNVDNLSDDQKEVFNVRLKIDLHIKA
jgi:hypothetical protein